VAFLVAALTVWSLTTTNTVSVNFENRSGRPLQNFTVITRGHPVKFEEDMLAGEAGEFKDDPRLVFDLRVSFDVGGQHYDLPARTYMLPFGNSVVLLSLDRELRLSIQSVPTFMTR
jgi:hypothetical protein